LAALSFAARAEVESQATIEARSWRYRRSQIVRSASELSQQVRMLFASQELSRPLSRSELEAQLGGHVSLESTQGRPGSAILRDPVSHVQVAELLFDQSGEWVGFTIIWKGNSAVPEATNNWALTPINALIRLTGPLIGFPPGALFWLLLILARTLGFARRGPSATRYLVASSLGCVCATIAYETDILYDRSGRLLGGTSKFDIVMLACATAMLTISLVVRWHEAEERHRSSTSELCPICQYNLKGNLSGTCPECGSKVPVKE
jgi:hypothetical protein